MQQNYVGRFAPTPSGPLHYGSLVAATASYLQAKHKNGQWLLRIEDIDPPREVAGAADDIRTTLEDFLFEWDLEPLYQSTRLDQYRSVIKNLIQENQIYACACSRKDLAVNVQKSELGHHYPGTCASKQLDTNDHNLNLRFRVADEAIVFQDGHFGTVRHNLKQEIGDIIIYRKFDLPSYSLAVTVDDAYQGVTEVVRGHDLLAFTPIQILLCQHLHLKTPSFLHIPVITNQQKQKLSKQTGATALDKQQRKQLLINALSHLGQTLSKDIEQGSLAEIWQWAIHHWDVNTIPKSKHIPLA